METKRGEIEGKERQQDTTTYTKGGQAQQSVANSHFIFVMLTVPSSYPLSEGDKTERRGRERLHSDTHLSPRSFLYPPPSHTLFFEQYLRVENNSSHNSPLDSVSIQGSCEQGLQPLLATLNSRSLLSATISPSNLLYV